MAHISIKEHAGVLKIRLDRPDRHNAFHPQMIAELTEAFRTAAQREEVRVVVLSGEGKSFCSGADLAWMKSMADYTLEENREDSHKLFDMFEAARLCPVPVIGQIHGNVMGGATGLVAICDIAAAEESTRFGFTEVRLGLAPAVISPFVLRKLAPAAAREWMLTGRLFSAQEAKEAGLVQFVGTSEEVDQYVRKTINRFLQCGPEAVRETKKLISFVEENQWSSMKEKTASVIAERRVSEEGQEGLRAFFEKSNPSWKKG